MKVPFSLNAMVSKNEIGGVKLNIRDGETDIELCTVSIENNQGNGMSSYVIDSYQSYAIFDLSGFNIKSFYPGKYYKIQLAFISNNNEKTVGYYSTVSIIKCTYYPTVVIEEFENITQNYIYVDTIIYTGTYTNKKDYSEKCSQYKFTLYNSDNEILFDTDWKIHNSFNDSNGESSDSYVLQYECASGVKYSLQYSVITTSGLIVNSKKYELIGGYSINSDIQAHLIAQQNYEEGCVDFYFKKMNSENLNASGVFILYRGEASSNYTVYTNLAVINLNGPIPSERIFRDYTIEHGETYRYFLRQKNCHQIYSEKIYAINLDDYNKAIRDIKIKKKFTTDMQVLNYCNTLSRERNLELGIYDVKAMFEYAFLFDGDRQLKIKFNSKVSSFKNVLQETKKNTLGSKYPFFFRSGITNYKEFPISGLISYLSDEDNAFLNWDSDLELEEPTTNITDNNMAAEKKFKLNVLEWLSNGKVKLFRSPSEGNYLVKLLNVSLSPNDTLSRMIHTFNCTADEVDEFNIQNLIKYNILQPKEEQYYYLQFRTMNLTEYYNGCDIYARNMMVYGSAAAMSYADKIDYLTDHFLSNKKCQYIKLEDCIPGEVSFAIDGQKYYVGATGVYEITLPEDSAINNISLKGLKPNTQGQITVGVWEIKNTLFEQIARIEQEEVIDFPSYSTDNFIDTLTDLKQRVKHFYMMDFKLNDLVFEVNDIEDLVKDYNLNLRFLRNNEYEVKVQQDEEYIITFEDNTEFTVANKNNPSVIITDSKTRKDVYNTLIKSTPGFFDYIVTYPNTNINIAAGKTYKSIQQDYSIIFINESIVHDKKRDQLFKIQRIDNDQNEPIENDDIPLFKLTLYPDSNTSTQCFVEDKNGNTVELRPTEICIDGDIFDILDTKHLRYCPIDVMPKYVKWGYKVNACMIYSLLHITYNVETEEVISTMPIQNYYYTIINNQCNILSDFYNIDGNIIQINNSNSLMYQNLVQCYNIYSNCVKIKNALLMNLVPVINVEDSEDFDTYFNTILSWNNIELTEKDSSIDENKQYYIWDKDHLKFKSCSSLEAYTELSIFKNAWINNIQPIYENYSEEFAVIEYPYWHYLMPQVVLYKQSNNLYNSNDTKESLLTEITKAIKLAKDNYFQCLSQIFMWSGVDISGGDLL